MLALLLELSLARAMPKALQSPNLKTAVLRSLQQFRSQRRPAPTLLPQTKALTLPNLKSAVLRSL